MRGEVGVHAVHCKMLMMKECVFKVREAAFTTPTGDHDMNLHVSNKVDPRHHQGGIAAHPSWSPGPFRKGRLQCSSGPRNQDAWSGAQHG